MRPFLVQIKDGSTVVHEFGDVGTDSITVAYKHEPTCEGKQYVRVIPVVAVGEESFSLRSVRHELEEKRIAEVVG